VLTKYDEGFGEMKEIFVEAQTLPEAYHRALVELMENGDVVECPDYSQLDVGTYMHRSNSMHCYEKDFGLLESFVEGIKTRTLEELTYEYEGYYEMLMEEEIPAIMRKVENMKNEMGEAGCD